MPAVSHEPPSSEEVCGDDSSATALEELAAHEEATVDVKKQVADLRAVIAELDESLKRQREASQKLADNKGAETIDRILRQIQARSA